MNTIVTTAIQPPDELTSFEKGHAFEDYIISLFDNKSKRFRLLEWRSDKIASNGMFVESNSLPDLEFSFTGNRKQKFAIECKWRKEFKDGIIKWATVSQIRSYQVYERQTRTPVFIAIGVGGLPSNPDKLFVTPLCNISSYNEVYENDLIPYKRNPKHKFFFDAMQLKLF